jgi:hypothetical protein
MNKNGHQPKFTLQMTLPQFERMFPDEEACRNYLFYHRWPDGVKCPRCHKSEHVYKIAQPWKWECWNAECAKGHAYRFSLIAGTIFENTKYPLRTWFQVAYLMCQSKKGISALQIHRQIGSGEYRTAWYMCHRIRAAMKNQTFGELMGEVEIDETYIGGKDTNRHASKKTHMRGGSDKKAVIGAISRKGNVVCQMIERADSFTIRRFVDHTVSKNVELISTDEHGGYQYLARWDNLPHQTVRHTQGEYVRGVVHTNTIESFWSLLKRGVMGTFHNVSKEYLPLYLNEFTFRHNERKNPDIFARLISSV